MICNREPFKRCCCSTLDFKKDIFLPRRRTVSVSVPSIMSSRESINISVYLPEEPRCGFVEKMRKNRILSKDNLMYSLERSVFPFLENEVKSNPPKSLGQDILPSLATTIWSSSMLRTEDLPSQATANGNSSTLRSVESLKSIKLPPIILDVKAKQDILIFVLSLPADIQKYIYKEFLEIEILYNKINNFVLYRCSDLSRETTTILSRYVKIIINNKKLKKYFISKSEIFKTIFKQKTNKKTIFSLVTNYYEDFSLAWVWMIHH